jgi:hypothetical protein
VKNRLWLVLAAAGGLVVMTAASPTGALWRDQAIMDPGDVHTGTLRLEAGGQEEDYVFDAISAANLVPGQSVRAPLVITNSGSTDMLYGLAGVTTTAETAADQDLAEGLLLRVTDDAGCGPSEAGGAAALYQGPLGPGATFTGRELPPSGSETVCITVTLGSGTPASAAAGGVQVIFSFRGDQRL